MSALTLLLLLLPPSPPLAPAGFTAAPTVSPSTGAASLTAVSCTAAPATTAGRGRADERDERWQEDLATLVREFTARHVDPFRHEPKEEYDARAAELHDRIPDLTDAQVVVEFMRLVGLAGDSHSGVRAAFFEGPRLPILWSWFDDGLRVVATRREDARLQGARLEAVAGRPLAEVVELLEEATAFGNEPWRREQVPGHLLFPAYLSALGLGDDPGGAELTFTLAGGDSLTEVLRAGPGPLANRLTLPTRQGPTAPRAEWHSFTVVPEAAILYVQYNKCMTSDEYPIADFTERLVEAAGTEGLRAVVFDLQSNSGGNSMLGDLLFARVFPRLAPSVRQHAYCVIGRRTFSSGLLNAVRLKSAYGATLVGQATGGALNHFGEVRTFELPNSRLTVAYSTKEFRSVPGDGLTLEPDLRVAPTYEDFMAGRDVVWEAILEHLGD